MSWATSPSSRSGFLSTPSARRATAVLRQRYSLCEISIHALREEGDDILTPPDSAGALFLSTPSARRATLTSFHFCVTLVLISIHALREEGDVEGNKPKE